MPNFAIQTDIQKLPPGFEICDVKFVSRIPHEQVVVFLRKI
jgi:hypothetical protein